MRRWKWSVVVGGAALCVASLLTLRACARSNATDTKRDNSNTGGETDRHRARFDRRHQARASIAGAVLDDANAPVARARVCAELSEEELPRSTRDPRCTTADEQGRYKVIDLIAGEYTVSALADKHLPQHLEPFELHAGENRTNVNVLLHAGGVQITGTVSDLGGGPVAHAQVEAFPTTTFQHTAAIETDDAGRFTMWVWAGPIGVSAIADGYSSTTVWSTAPGAFELALTPAASVSGTVIDARTKAPVSDATVRLEAKPDTMYAGFGASDLTDEIGRFRIDRVTPGRYFVIAVAEHGYGRSAGSIRVGLGQRVEDVTVMVGPAVSVSGRVMIEGASPTPCPKPSLFLSRAPDRDIMLAHPVSDGAVRVDGVLPGTYNVGVHCVGYDLAEAAPDVEVVDHDVSGLVWKVVPSAEGTVKGRVLTSAGSPVQGAQVSMSGGSRADDTTNADGVYELKHLMTGKHEMTVRSDLGVAPERGWSVEVTAGATVVKDLVLQQGGTIVGSVATADGKPVGGVGVMTQVGSEYLQAKSGDNGRFRFENIPAGEQSLVAFADGDGSRGRVVVRPGQTSNIDLIVEARNGRITGTVVGTTGQPRNDVFVTATREYGSRADTHESWREDRDRVLTGVDGTFAVAPLAEGLYSLRVYEPGGNEVILEHVKTGANVRVQLKPTGSIAGTIATSNGAPIDLQIQADDRRSGLSRRERFYRTDGRYRFDELPAGSYRITAREGGVEGQTTVDLAEGAHVDGVDLRLGTPVTIKGRVVDLASRQPISNGTVRATLVGGRQPHDGATTGDGTFVIDGVPAGEVEVGVWGPKGTDYRGTMIKRQVSGDEVELGDLVIVKQRYHRGDVVGRIGVTFAGDSLRIIEIDPSGPAAKTDLKVGDVVTSIDAINVVGVDAETARSLLYVPVGTTIRLGLGRGTTVAIVTAPRTP